MAYSTPAMVRLACNPDGSDGTTPPSPISRTAADFTDAQLVDFIAEADAMIDGYIGRFYTVPVARIITDEANAGLGDGAGIGNVPHPIDYWSRNLAAYYATLSQRKSQDFTADDPIRQRYTATMQALDAIATGKIRLSIPDNTTSAAGVGAGSAINPTYVGNLFGPDDFNLHPVNPMWPLWPDNPGRNW